MLKRATFLAVAGLTLVAAGPTQAQQALNPTGSMDIDPFWEVMCVSNLTYTPDSCSNVWRDASRITADPGGWGDVPVNGAYYIGATSSGSVDPGIRGEGANYTYTFRTHLDLGGYTGSVQLDLSTFLFDNYWVGWSFDGTDFYDFGISPEPLGVNQNNWSTEFQLTATGTVTAPDDYLYLRITGNGRTDGILASGTISVPEPGTYGLLFAGLMGLGLVGIRRRVAEG